MRTVDQIKARYLELVHDFSIWGINSDNGQELESLLKEALVILGQPVTQDELEAADARNEIKDQTIA